jgi:hypothetical protein
MDLDGYSIMDYYQVLDYYSRKMLEINEKQIGYMIFFFLGPFSNILKMPRYPAGE